MKYLNRYTFFARYIPGLISALPLTLLYFFVTKRFNDYELKEYFESVTFILGISATFILTFFISMITRELGSFLEKKYFITNQGFPTNYLMLYQNNNLPNQSKDRYGEKLYTDFGIKRLNAIDENNNIDEAIKILSQASRMVSTKYQQNEQVKDANIAYGFARNLSGGLFISIPASITAIIVGFFLNDDALILWSSVAAIIFIILSFFHKQWIISNAEKYGEKLITVYLSDKF